MAFPGFGPMYPPSGQLGPPPSPQSHSSQPPQHSQSAQQQTIVITENPNIRKIRSASTENTMPEGIQYVCVYLAWILYYCLIKLLLCLQISV